MIRGAYPTSFTLRITPSVLCLGGLVLLILLILLILLAPRAMSEDSLVPTAPDPKGGQPATTVPSVTPAAVDVVEEEGVSRFGKISVRGSDQNTRGGISSMANAMHTELCKLCAAPEYKIKLPIIIQLYGAEGDAELKRHIVSKIDQVQGQYQLKLHVHLAKGVDHKLLRYHLMELLLYDRGLGAGQFVEKGERVLVKPWLITGLLEALDIKAGRADKRIYQAELPYFGILPLQQVFDSSEKSWLEMDGRKPLAFRAISGAMTNALLRQPGGRPSMSAYLAEVATFKGETENLMRKHFPGMNKSRNSLGKWVNLEMLELGTARMTQVYSIVETDKRLDSVLKLRYRGEKGAAMAVDIDGYADVIKLKPAERYEAAAGARAELERLSYRCFPIYRPLIGEYEMLLREIVSGKDKDIKVRLTKLTDVRLKMLGSGRRVRDYLDWYYITQSSEVTGDYQKYRALTNALEEERLRPRTGDDTQRYLDDVQRIYGGDSGKDK